HPTKRNGAGLARCGRITNADREEKTLGGAVRIELDSGINQIFGNATPCVRNRPAEARALAAIARAINPAFAERRSQCGNFGDRVHEDFPHVGFRAAQVRAAQVRAAQVRAAQVRAAQVRAAQVRAAQVRAAQVRAAQVRAAQVRAAQVRAAQVRVALHGGNHACAQIVGLAFPEARGSPAVENLNLHAAAFPSRAMKLAAARLIHSAADCPASFAARRIASYWAFRMSTVTAYRLDSRPFMTGEYHSRTGSQVNFQIFSERIAAWQFRTNAGSSAFTFSTTF